MPDPEPFNLTLYLISFVWYQIVPHFVVVMTHCDLK